MARTSLCLLPVLSVLSLGRGFSQDGVLISGFEDPEATSGAVASRARFEIAGGDRKSGERALRVTFEGVPEGQRDHPAFVLQGRSLRIKDFSRFEALRFWVKNLESSAAELSVAVWDSAGRRSFPRPSTFVVKPGEWLQASCRLVLHGLDARDIGSVHFFQDVNRGPRSFLLDHIELLSPRAARIIQRKQEVLDSLERARKSASQIGLDAIVGSDIERLSKRLQEVLEPESSTTRAVHAEEQLVALSRMAQEAANLADSIVLFDKGRGLTLVGAKVSDSWLKNSKKLSGIIRLNLVATAVTDAGLAQLKDLELQSLALQGKALTGAGLAALPGGKLLELHLDGSGAHDAALVHLARFPNLRFLNLAYTRVTDAGLLHVARLPHLESLHLDGTATTDAGLAHLGRLDSLGTLSLQRTRVTGAGLVHLKDLRNLKTLGLEDTRVKDDGLEALGGLSLETLDLSGTEIIGGGLARLETLLGLDFIGDGLHKLVTLDLNGTRVNDSALTGIGKLANLKRLEVSSTRITDASLIHVAASSQLLYLDLYGTNVTDAGLRHLANQGALQELYLGGTAATDAALGALKGLGDLERLDLQGTRISDAGLEGLEGFKKLAVLSLAGTSITGSGIVHARGLEALQSLDLSNTQVSDAALVHVASLHGLRSLNLSGTAVTDAGLEPIARLEKLRELGLEGTRVSDAGIVHLRKLPALRVLRLDDTMVSDTGFTTLEGTKSLVSLSLSRTRISDAGLAQLGDRFQTLILRNTAISDAGIGHLRGKDRLEHLELAGTDITERAVEALAALPNLRVLDLSDTRITDASLQLLASLAGLEDLRLDRTPITDVGAERLAAAPRLNHVSLEGTRVGVQGKMFLARKRPEVRVVLNHPWIEDASLSRYSVRAGPASDAAAGATLAGLRQLGSIRSLRLHRTAIDEGELLSLKDLPNLEHLDLRGTALDDAALVHFVQLQRLLSLDLSGTRVTDAGLKHLRDMQALIALDLEGTAIRGPGLSQLESLARLQSLNLRNTPFSDDGAAAVLALTALRKLELTNTRLTDRGVELLASLPNLRYLDLFGTRITDKALAALGRMTELRQLYLSSTALTDAGVRLLRPLNQLGELGLDGTGIGDAGCASLDAFPHLERLRLGRTSITDRGLEPVARLAALRSLEIDDTKITDAGVRHLLRLTKLETLVLDGSAVSDAAMTPLSGLAALEKLSVRRTRVTESGVRDFSSRRPNTAVLLHDGEPGPSVIGVALSIVYCLLAGAICIYGFHRYWLVWLFARDRQARSAPIPTERFTAFPRVTIQLPMFNERRVAERVIEAACAIDYPQDRLQIQVLDDSTDESADLARACCERFRAAGLDIEYVHRGSRTGFKGGALEAGLNSASGEFLAVFDADFVPSPDILQRTIHHFTDPEVGMVQTEWAHLNRGESLLTECQAIFLDGHFVIEQTTRFRNGKWFNFNGTAGVWRRRCIEEAGGWHHDTLTEDTDLSYRAQLDGWRFVYLPTVRSSAELPSTMSAFLGQQQRWTKGLLQNAVKLLPRILHSKASAAVKAEAWFHLTSPLMYLVMFLLTALALPAILISTPLAELSAFPALAIGMSVLLMGTLAAAAFLITSQHAQGLGIWRTVVRLPAVMALGIGMSAANARAAIEALLGVRGPFVRTPKFNGRTDFDPDPASRRRLGVPAGLLELAAAGVMLASLVLSFRRPFTLIGAPFLLLFACGYFWVGAASLGRVKWSGGILSRSVRLTLATAAASLVGGAVLACVLGSGRSRSAGTELLTLGVDLARADWKHRGAAISGVASSPGGLEIEVGLDRDHDAGELFLDLDGSLAPLGDSLASGREVRFEVRHPQRFSGELQVFASDAAGRSQYGSTVFVERQDASRGARVVLSPSPWTPPMGYSDPEFDPARGIHRIGLKVSAQSDRVLRRGYRPFNGIVTIVGVRILDFPVPVEPEVRTPSPGSIIPVRPTPTDEFLAHSGVDRPWPFGYGFSGPISGTHREELERSYGAMGRKGLGFTRVYLGDYRTGLIFGEKGTVSGIDGQFLDLLDAIAEAANRHGIMVMFSLMDNTIADGKGVEYREIIADPEASESFVRNAIVPIVRRLEERKVIIDLFNEPENVTEIPLRVVQRYVDRAIGMVREAVPAARLTVVSRSREELRYWRGRGLDVLSHNVFDARTLAAATSGAELLEVDAPLVIAEMDPSLATRENLEALRRAGYRGVGVWGWGTEDRYAWGTEDLDRIVAPLLGVAERPGEQ